ncbi:MAG: DUF3619 family protein [Gammaproteobacteria bacterium]|nr:DUF3619 family protein [Gammaproteobacteria bacterium]
MKHDDEDELLRRVKRQLDEKADGLDGETLSDLNQRRQAVLNQAGKSTPVAVWQNIMALSSNHPWAIPASTAAVAVVAILTWNVWNNSTWISQVEPGVLEDMELLSSHENLEFYSELEFYEWLEDEANSG